MSLITPGFHHVTLVSGDALRTRQFYGEILGLTLAKRIADPEEPTVHQLFFEAGTGMPGTLLAFRERPHSGAGHPGIGGVHHIALGVEDETALLMWKRWLTDHGVYVSGPYDRRWFHSLYFRDPDGQILEIATKGPGYAVDEPAGALGEKEIIPDASHLRGGRDERAIRRHMYPEAVDHLTPRMSLQGIHHVSGITDDVQRANDFLGEALGLRLVKRSVNQDAPGMPHWFWARYDGVEVAAHSSYTLFGFPSNGRDVVEGVGQTHEVVFRTGDEAELESWRESLLSRKVPVTPVRDRGYFRSIHFRAPDGARLGVATDVPGVHPDEAEGTGREPRP